QSDHVNVVAGEAVTSALELCRIHRAGLNRRDETIEADDVKEERIVRHSGKERNAGGRIRCNRELGRGRAETGHSSGRRERLATGQRYLGSLRLAARGLRREHYVDELIGNGVPGVLDLKLEVYFRREKAEVEHFRRDDKTFNIHRKY